MTQHRTPEQRRPDGEITDEMVDEAIAAINGKEWWRSVSPTTAGTWRVDMRRALTAAIQVQQGGWRPTNRVTHSKLPLHPAWWTYDAEAEAYYFAPSNAAKPPYLTQRRVTAVLDIAKDGTLAGIELVDGPLPAPPESQHNTGER